MTQFEKLAWHLEKLRKKTKNFGQNSRSLGLKPGLFEAVFLNSLKKIKTLFSSVV